MLLNSFQALLLLIFTVFKPIADWLVNNYKSFVWETSRKSIEVSYISFTDINRWEHAVGKGQTTSKRSKYLFNFLDCNRPFKGLFTWSGGPRSSGVGFFCFHALGNTKQKKLTPLYRGPPLYVNRVLVCMFCFPNSDHINQSINQHIYFTTLNTHNKSWFPGGA